MADNWTALKKIAPPEVCGEFMAMMSVKVCGVTMYAYKHIDTRDYLFVSADGRCWRRVNGDFRLSDADSELSRVRGARLDAISTGREG